MRSADECVAPGRRQRPERLAELPTGVSPLQKRIWKWDFYPCSSWNCFFHIRFCHLWCELPLLTVLVARLKLVKNWNFEFLPQTTSKMFFGTWSDIVENCLQKDPVVFGKNHFLWGARGRFEKTGSHTLPHTHALLTKEHGAGWQYYCVQLGKDHHDPTSPVFKEIKSFCIHWQTRRSWRPLEGCDTKPHRMCEQPDLAGLSGAEVLCSKTCGACCGSNSMKRRVLGGCMTWSTCPSVAKLSTSSRPWIKRASVIIITPNVWSGAEEKTSTTEFFVFQQSFYWTRRFDPPGQNVVNKTIAGRRRTLLLNVKPARMSVKREDFSKRRMVRNGLEGKSALEDEDREAGGWRHEASGRQTFHPKPPSLLKSNPVEFTKVLHT